jgi:hypothetical protein
MRPQGFGQGGSGLEDLGWNDMGFEPPKPAETERDVDHDAFGDDVVEHPRAHHPTGLTPVQSPVHDQQAEIADRLGTDEGEEEDEIDETAELYESEAEEQPVVAEFAAPVLKEEVVEETVAPLAMPTVPPARRRAPRPRAMAGSKGKAAFTLRLDPDRHLKLRLACAVDGRSAQQLVTDALDHLLERMPDLDGLAAKAKSRG